ncbi:MAG: hypothetical protein QOE11_238, partial [Solirubrobacteraceae bacterium]|nr:hypothetical protein [Solirubrobacteraceae bacterium]
MSTQTDFSPRTYRGTDLDELLPKIREELGPDAMVVRQREGLHGGLGGFFQRRCVEVVARRATPRVNVYDDGPAQALPESESEHEPASPAIREIMRVASPFVEQLQAAQAQRREPSTNGAVAVAEPIAAWDARELIEDEPLAAAPVAPEPDPD